MARLCVLKGAGGCLLGYDNVGEWNEMGWMGDWVGGLKGKEFICICIFASAFGIVLVVILYE